MLTIHDLHFNNEIVPLFDHVYNEFARDVLLQWMTDRPSSVGEVYARQAILKALIGHDHLFRPFAYSRTEFHETYSYLKEIAAREKSIFFFSRARRNREIGQLSNLFIFFHKIDEAWFQSLRINEFPEDFRPTILCIRKLFEDLDVRHHYDVVRTHSLRATALPRLARLIIEKVGNGEVAAFWNAFFFFEACLSLAKGIIKHQFHFPTFIEEGLTIRGFYHPLIHNPVLNDIRVTETVTLITGPNMSGKSTLLKAIGLCVTLAHLGLAVPAETCELAWFDVISIAINLNDDILNGYSHFMTEVMNLKNVLLQARETRRCFAIFDELFRGTNPEDALAISNRTIHGLTQFRHSSFFISTHLHRLKESTLSDKNVRTHFIECQLARNKPVFTYNLREGWSDLRIGQIIFEQEGLNDLLSDNGHDFVSHSDSHLPLPNSSTPPTTYLCCATSSRSPSATSGGASHFPPSTSSASPSAWHPPS
jgi:DNA mismatch repair protein MutS